MVEVVRYEKYEPVELPSQENERSKVLRSLKDKVILFQDFHKGKFYEKGVLKNNNNQEYWVEFLGGLNWDQPTIDKYYIQNLTGLMVKL